MITRNGLTVLFVVLVLAVAAVPVGAVPSMAAGVGAAAQEGGQNGTNANNASLGASISGFMQASAANAEGEVEDKMFSARFETAPEQRRAAIVQGRVANLDDRLDRLREQRAELLNESDGEPSVATRAKAARLTARINALQEAINTTSEAADRAGVNVTRLNELQENASQLSGPEVAELARGLAGTARGPPLDGERGAPADRGNGDGQPDDTGADGGAQVDGNTTDDNSDDRGPGASNGNSNDGGDGGADSAAATDGNETDATGDGSA